MRTPLDRRSFLRIAGSSLGIGVLYQVAPLYCAGDTMSQLGRANGERVTTKMSPCSTGTFIRTMFRKSGV